MSVQGGEPFDWGRITVARARVLRELELQDTEAEAAEALVLSLNGLRSHVRDLKDITGAGSVSELRRWWRANRGRWVTAMAVAAGLPEAHLAS